MTAAQSDTLFPMPEPVKSPELSWEDRAIIFADMAKSRGGLLPSCAAQEVLGVSRQRVHQLIAAGQLESVKFHGILFVTGQSLRAVVNSQEPLGGRGHKRPSVWRAISIGAKTAFATGVAISGDD